MEPTQLEIEDSLVKLGQSADDVAATLASLGLKGRTCQSLICPVAVYLHREFPNSYVEVGGSHCVVDWTECELTRAVSDFVLHFDAGDYAELVASTDAERAFLDAYQHASLTEEER